MSVVMKVFSLKMVGGEDLKGVGKKGGVFLRTVLNEMVREYKLGEEFECGEGEEEVQWEVGFMKSCNRMMFEMYRVMKKSFIDSDSYLESVFRDYQFGLKSQFEAKEGGFNQLMVVRQWKGFVESVLLIRVSSQDQEDQNCEQWKTLRLIDEGFRQQVGYMDWLRVNQENQAQFATTVEALGMMMEDQERDDVLELLGKEADR